MPHLLHPSRSVVAGVTAALGLTLGGAVTVVQALDAPTSSDVAARRIALTGGNTRIIGGSQITDQKQNPGAVLLSNSGMQHCSATRISPTWVLTARHCDKMPDNGEKYRVDGVWTDSVRATQGPKARVVRMINAPKGDQMLVEIDGKTPGPVAPWSAVLPPVGELVTMMGWGNTDVGGYPSNILKKGTGKYAGRNPAPYFGGDDAIIKEAPDTAWSGDSGGPVMYNGKVFGDLSWGTADSLPKGKRENGYVPFEQNADWIIKTSGVNPDGPQYYYTPGQPIPSPGQPAPTPTTPPQPQPTSAPTQPAPWPTPTRPVPTGPGQPQPTQPAPWPTPTRPVPTGPGQPQPTQPAPWPTPTRPVPTGQPQPTQPGPTQPQPQPTRPRPTWPGMPGMP